MPENEMVERVARAIFDAPDPTSGDQIAEALAHSPFIGEGDADYRDDIMAICRAAARAAIEAMREPTKAMMAAVERAENESGCIAEAYEHIDWDHAWPVAIDAALSPETGE